MSKQRPQIDPWGAISFAAGIDDHYDCLEFLNACLHGDMMALIDGDMMALIEDWPEFAHLQPEEGE